MKKREASYCCSFTLEALGLPILSNEQRDLTLCMYILYPTKRHYMYNDGKRVCVQHTHEHHRCTVQDKILECPKFQASELASITLFII